MAGIDPVNQDGVEFLVDGSDSEDEEIDDVLDVGRAGRRSPARRSLTWVAAGVALTGAIVWWAGTRPSPSPSHAAAPHPATASTATRPPSPGQPTPAYGSTLSITLEGPDLASCGDTAECAASDVTPPDVRAAFRSHLPGSDRVAVSTIARRASGTGPAMLVTRLIEAHIGAVDVLVRVRANAYLPARPLAALTPTPPGLASALVRLESAGFVVLVQWTAPDTVPPPMSKIQALADDPRLEALP